MRTRAWTHIARTAAALAAAMGIGRFVYTPILPLMTAQAHLAVQSAGQLATANYVGYLVGAVAAAVSPRLARSVTACRWSPGGPGGKPGGNAIAPPTSLTGWRCGWLRGSPVPWCSSSPSTSCWITCTDTRPICRAGGSAVSVSASRCRPPWCSSLPTNAGWRAAWWTAAALAAVLSAAAWSMRPVAAPVIVATPNMPRHNVNRPFALLFGSYTLEGIGYIIAGTFLVAAVAQHSPGWLGNGAWLVVGLAAIPSAALWGGLSSAVLAPGTAHRRPAAAGRPGSPWRASPAVPRPWWEQSCSAARSSG